MDLFEFTRQATTARTAQPIIAVLRSRVPPHTTGASLIPFLRVVMGCARHFNEDLGDVDSAVALWSEVYNRSPDPDGPHAVLAIMMSVANKRGHSSLARENRDIAGAVRIYEAVYRFRASPDQDKRIACTMMDVANRLTDLRVPGRPTDVAGAIQIWRAIGDLPASADDRNRVVLTMLGVATRLSNLEATRSSRDIGAAVRLWQAAWRMAREVDADLGLQVVRTMMDVANRLTDLSGNPSDIDVDAAILIWAGIVEASTDAEDRERVVRTMMALAGWLLGPNAHADGVVAAIKLYHACWRFTTSGPDRLRVTKTLFDTVPRAPDACGWALAALRLGQGEFTQGRFRASVEAGLLYYQDDIETVVALVDASPSPRAELLALRADALRKLHRYEEAIDACSRVLARVVSAGEDAILDRDARVSALCCRGYS